MREPESEPSGDVSLSTALLCSPPARHPFSPRGAYVTALSPSVQQPLTIFHSPQRSLPLSTS